jgi:oxaloacetate decarboxylase alpha subunit
MVLKKRTIRLTDTTLLNAQQILWSSRLRTSDIIPVLKKLDDIGYHSIEMWGGATFDACIRYLNEDPWERLRTIKSHIKKTPLQMLLRGQSLVGYKNYSDDVVYKFVCAAVKNGINIIRVFDALNDAKNLRTVVLASKENGVEVQCAVVYTESPVHRINSYLRLVEEFVNMGADSICIKDMSGLLTPYRTYGMVEAIKRNFPEVPLQLHCHYVNGYATMNYIKAVEAGADLLDTAAFPLAFTNSLPATETIVESLKDTPYDTDLDIGQLYEIADYFAALGEKEGYKSENIPALQMKITKNQISSGMISSLIDQLNQQKSISKLEDVLQEIPKIRAEVGYPPLVAPLSNIIGTQAVLNVLTGKRWSVIVDEMREYISGCYGKPPGPVSKEIRLIVLGNESHADRLSEPPKDDYVLAATEISDIAKDSEDVLTYCMLPELAGKFLSQKAGLKGQVSKNKIFSSQEASMDLNKIREIIKLVEDSNLSEITVEEGDFKLTVRKDNQVTMKLGYQQEDEEKVEERTEGTAMKEVMEDSIELKSPMVGTLYRSPATGKPPFVEVGESVKKGQTLCIIEAMKMMNNITSEYKGSIIEICVEDATPVEYGQRLFVIRKG